MLFKTWKTFLLWVKKDIILKKSLRSNVVSDPIGFHYVDQNVLQNTVFYVPQKKVSHIVLEWHECDICNDI